jgi:hypothetical protein
LGFPPTTVLRPAYPEEGHHPLAACFARCTPPGMLLRSLLAPWYAASLAPPGMLLRSLLARAP